jgi:hypothetical protein
MSLHGCCIGEGGSVFTPTGKFKYMVVKMKKISYPEWEIVMMGFAHLFLKSWV